MGVDYRAIGRRIKTKRRSVGKTQDNLAEALSVSVGYISQLERGVTKINLETLYRIARVLGCGAVDLLCDLPPKVRAPEPDEEELEAELRKMSRRMSPARRRLLLSVAKAMVDPQEEEF